jgi:transglutaminase-like putative cysteine protease
MRLIIKHVTRYRYRTALSRITQSVRMHPTSNSAQQVIRWQVSGTDGRPLSSTADGFGNIIQLHHPENPGTLVVLSVEGEVETKNTDGVVALAAELLPPMFFTASTDYTKADAAIVALAHEAADQAENILATLHQLMALARERIDYTVDVTGVDHTASEALAQGTGVCQDHAHVMISAARTLNIPARYVSGYLWTADRQDHVASHAWMEALVPQLGWVGFDAANLVCPDDRYVRLAYGRDYADAAPVRGVRVGGLDETLDVTVQVRTASQQ